MSASLCIRCGIGLVTPQRPICGYCGLAGCAPTPDPFIHPHFQFPPAQCEHGFAPASCGLCAERTAMLLELMEDDSQFFTEGHTLIDPAVCACLRVTPKINPR